jgi:hypothetical protein
MKRKRHRTIDPAKAAAAAGGDPGWYRSIPVVDNRPTCTKCGTRTALLGLDGECLKCRLQERTAAREASA